MNRKSVDARGELCPKPLIMTKKALKNFDGELEILLDNDTAFENVQRYLGDNGRVFSTAKDGAVFSILVNSDGASEEMSSPEAYCPVPAAFDAAALNTVRPHVIAFKNDKMGEGDDELGRILVQGFCNTIKETEPLPSTLVFYNSGVKLAASGSPVLPALKELEALGVKILVCGTCTDYFNLKERISVGVISNMYDILGSLTAAGHVIFP